MLRGLDLTVRTLQPVRPDEPVIQQLRSRLQLTVATLRADLDKLVALYNTHAPLFAKTVDEVQAEAAAADLAQKKALAQHYFSTADAISQLYVDPYQR